MKEGRGGKSGRFTAGIQQCHWAPEAEKPGALGRGRVEVGVRKEWEHESPREDRAAASRPAPLPPWQNVLPESSPRTRLGQVGTGRQRSLTL